jgi:hypothetical protein
VRQIATRAPVRFANALLAGMMLWVVSGCGSFGPTTVNRDRPEDSAGNPDDPGELDGMEKVLL